MIKMQITLPETAMTTLREDAERKGVTPNLLARMQLIRVYRVDDTSERQVLEVPVNNYGEIKTYVEEKQLGNVNTFAAFAMKQYMTRYPLKTALKKENE